MKGFVRTFANCPVESQVVTNEIIYISKQEITKIEKHDAKDIVIMYHGIANPEDELVCLCKTRDGMIYFADNEDFDENNPIKETLETIATQLTTINETFNWYDKTHENQMNKFLDKFEITNEHLKDIGTYIYGIGYDDSNVVEAIESLGESVKKKIKK